MTTKAHIIVLTALAIAALSAGAHAQSVSRGIPNAAQGFSQNKNEPVNIEASALEVRDKDKVATFTGNVNVTQGDTNMKCKSLVVFYDNDQATPGAMKAATPGPSGQQQIRRLEAKGGVTIVQKEQTAIGENGVFDMKANTFTLTGNVLLTQGPNVLRGDKLVVDMTTGLSRMESGKGSQGVVRALIQPGTTPQSKSDKTDGKADGKKDGKKDKSNNDASSGTARSASPAGSSSGSSAAGSAAPAAAPRQQSRTPTGSPIY